MNIAYGSDINSSEKEEIEKLIEKENVDLTDDFCLVIEGVAYIGEVEEENVNIRKSNII